MAIHDASFVRRRLCAVAWTLPRRRTAIGSLPVARIASWRVSPESNGPPE